MLNNVRAAENDSQHNVITNIRLIEKLLDKKLKRSRHLILHLLTMTWDMRKNILRVWALKKMI